MRGNRAPIVYMLFQLAERQPGESLAQLADRSIEGSGYRVVSGGETDINGLDAYSASYSQQVDDVGEVVARVAYIENGQSSYAFAGLAPVEPFRQVEEMINTSIRSFRELSPDEAESVRPNEIALYTAESGDTWQAIAHARHHERLPGQRAAQDRRCPQVVVEGRPVTGD